MAILFRTHPRPILSARESAYREACMLRGAEKRMIVVRTRDSRLFEEAYFVVRPEADRGDRDELNMVWEANRLLESSMDGWWSETMGSPHFPRSRRGGYRRGLWFLVGLLSGGGIVGLLWFLL